MISIKEVVIFTVFVFFTFDNDWVLFLYPLGFFMTAVNDAVIVAAGLGGRMLPASAYLPKESLPLVDVPAFIHLVREAVAAGVTRIHIIPSPKKDFSTFLDNKEDYHLLKPEISRELLTLDDSIEFLVHTQERVD